jgi:hypothetical protein
MEEQLCKACNTVKPLTGDYFSINRQTPSGFAYKCRQCLRTYQRERILRIKRDQYEDEPPQSENEKSFDEACMKEKFQSGKSSGYSIYKPVC